MNLTATTSFPGPRPYQYDEADQFWGREHFVKQISRYLHHERLAILSSPSGTGKTSLIQAGIIPYLQLNSQALANTPILQIRFTPYREADPVLPTEIFRLLLLGDQEAYPEIPLEEDSAWLVLKAFLADHSFGERVVLIFDQFEELFSYPEACVQDFLRQLGDLHAGAIPPNISKAIKRKRLLEPQACDNDFQRQVDWLNQSLQTHMLIAIEGDSLFQLERLLDHIPEALSRTHELPLLKRHDLHQFFQMHLPGQEVDARWIEEWENAPEACRNLRLQIWLQHLQEGGESDFMMPSLQDYYQQVLASLPSDADRVQALTLLEDHLISDDEQSRVVITEQALLQDYPPAVWEPLIDAGIICQISHYHHGKAYELSHDCWRKAVVNYYEQRQKVLTRKNWIKFTIVTALLFAGLGWAAGVTSSSSEPKYPGVGNPTRIDTVYLDSKTNKKYFRETIIKRDTIIQIDTVRMLPSGPCPPPVCVECDSLNQVIRELRIKINELQAQLPCPTPSKTRGVNDVRINLPIKVSSPYGNNVTNLNIRGYIHMVQAGETLNQIAERLNSPYDLTEIKRQIMELNFLLSENDIVAGKSLLLMQTYLR